MHRFIHPIFIALVAYLSGCATTKQSIPPILRIVNLPEIGEARTSELGDTLVQKGKIYTYDALRLENTVTNEKPSINTLTLEPGILKASMRDDERIYYTTEKMTVSGPMIGTKMHPGGLAINAVNEKDIKFIFEGRAIMNPSPAPILTKTQIADVERPSFRQEFIYNGRSGDTLKFLYREYSTDVLRAPFSQEVQYDIKDGMIIGFKGARIEVLEATNTVLKYRVRMSFPDN